MKIKTILYILLFTCTNITHAAIINSESCTDTPSYNYSQYTCINSITDIEILGVSYDLEVLTGTFDNLFPNPATNISYWGNQEWASAAVFSISNILDTQNTVPSSNDTYWTNVFHGTFLLLPYEYSYLSDVYFDNACLDINVQPIAGLCSRWDTTSIYAFASFTPTSVPLPASLWLLCSGLLFLIGLTTHKKIINS